MVDLFQASMNVLTRKDMSLTRRFYNWILISGTSETETLSDYNLSILTLAFKVKYKIYALGYFFRVL